ncbi:anaerobic ribonucleoside-triphosphate reductase activating protein [Candidatus Shapirobacteria bacterium CG11_big_fil_rev_8_21_14_0_20_40_12]|uniref:Anaerobic ribonucleoside-triphosphate reductase activating protein n=4 Tax=Candidatus Shapironibacteriota TaxID=1752721 RepID=A0A2H0KHA5_9BACT|nr:MAG: anaerobic ribonucleoside-triphosphate reductase activating protein [Candidatus Shapirobacteria bacterium CG11_big_fil_rev_8_21_14_0_20_40_12]
MEIAGYIKTSLIEWPGKISSVIFVPGCNFRCPFCHNADLVVRSKVSKFQSFKEKEVLADLEKRKKWVEAVAVTGGEPTLQADLSRFLSRLKQMGFLTMVESNGTKPEIINELIIKKLTDYIAMDIKGDLEDYERYTNVQCTIYDIQKSIELIVKSGVEYEFRTTVVPGLHNLENLTKLAKQVGKTPNIRWFLNQFRPMNCLDKKYLKIKPYSVEELKKICRNLQKIIPQTNLRGV